MMPDAGVLNEAAEQREQALREMGIQFAEMLTKAYELGLDQDAVMPLLDEWRARVGRTCAQQQQIVPSS